MLNYNIFIFNTKSMDIFISNTSIDHTFPLKIKNAQVLCDNLQVKTEAMTDLLPSYFIITSF